MTRGIIALILATAFAVPTFALPFGDTTESDYVIDYADLSYILKGSVLDMGPSTHKAPKRRTVQYTGTRMQIGNFLPTRQEGNRVMVHAFEEPEKAYLRKIRDELLAIPAQLPLTALSRNEQLAYWFNLHNIIVLVEIAEQYPVTDIKPFFDQNDPEAFVNLRRFSLGGELISIGDIQYHVLTHWPDPLVIYGFYFGAVGTPNIRTTAFTGSDVYDALRENAVDFINSLRGTQIWRTSELRVATYYERMSAVFPSFERDVQAHIMQYAKPDFRQRVINVSSVSAEINDWHIADLYNGRPFSQPGGLYARINQNIEDVSFKLRLPPHAEQLLRDRERKLFRLYRDRGGNVDIEELPKEKEPEEKPNPPE